MVVLATALILGISRNHAFEQGNKRTAFAAGVAFLEANDYALAVEDTAEFADILVAVITGERSEHGFIDALTEFVTPIEP